MEEANAFKQSGVERCEVVSKLCSQNEGLAVLCATVATLYQYDQDSTNGSGEADPGSDAIEGEAPGANWRAVNYGIPSVIATKSGVVLCLSDFDEDLPGHEISISSASQYTQISDHFSVIGVHNNTCYGVHFADVAVARKIAVLISQVLPSNTLTNVEAIEADVPAPKRMKISTSSLEGESDARGDNEWVVIERDDIPDDQTESTTAEQTVGTDAVDSPSIFSRHSKRRKSSQGARSPITISEPKEFRHVSHVGQETSVGQLTKTMTASVGESVIVPSEPKAIPSKGESGTVASSSFTEVYASGPGGSIPPPPPPPVAPPPPPPSTLSGTLKKTGLQPLVGMSLQDELLKGVTLKATNSSGPGGNAAGSIADELKRGIVLRPVGTLGKHLPKPPPLINQGKLLFEINTFKRNTLRHVETKNMTDYQDDDPNSLQAVLKTGLERMKGRLSLRNFSRVGSINGEGDEAGFEDEFDGPLFV